MSPMEITISDLQNPANAPIKLIQLQGQFDESNVDEKSKEIYELLDNTPPGTHYIFDMAGLEYMNSKSIGYLTDWYNRVLQSSGQIALAQAQDNILDILDTVGLTSIIEHHNTIDDAVQAMTS